MAKKALITGITGFVGSHLAEYLLGLGNVEVHGLTRWRSPKENLKDILGDITFGGWINPDSITQFDTVLENASGANGYRFWFNTTSTVACSVKGAGETGGISTSISEDVWSHIECVYDGTNLHIYKNGILMDSDTASGAITDGTNTVYIGKDSVLDRFYNGAMSDMRVYSRALSSEDVLDLYLSY